MKSISQNEQENLNKKLFYAAFTGNKEECEKLIEQGADIHAKDSNGCDLALLAIWGGHVDLYDDLINIHHFDQNAVDTFGNNAATLALLFDHRDIFDHLERNHGLDVEKRTNAGQNLLMTAAKKGHEEVVRKLVSHYPVNLSAKDDQGKTAQMLAEEAQHDDIVHLFKTIPALNKKLLQSVKEGDIEKFENLLSQGAQLHATDQKTGINAPLIAAAMGKIELFDHLVHHHHFDADAKNDDGLNAVFLATYNKRSPMVRHLIDHYCVDLQDKDHAGHSLQDVARINKNTNLANYLEWLDIRDNPEPTTEEMVSFISPSKKSKIWRDTQDPTFYYTFQDPKKISGGSQYRNAYGVKSAQPMSEEDKKIVRDVIKQECDEINAPFQEITLSSNDLNLLAAGIEFEQDGRTQTKLINDKKIIFIRSEPSTLKELYDKGIEEDTGFSSGSTIAHDPINNEYSYKVIILPKDILQDHPRYGISVLLHELGHAIGDLKHANPHEPRDLPPFSSRGSHPNISIPFEKTVMGYHRKSFSECFGLEEGAISAERMDPANPKFNECQDEIPISFTPIDIIAINRGLEKNRKRSSSPHIFEQEVDVAAMRVANHGDINSDSELIVAPPKFSEPTTMPNNQGLAVAAGMFTLAFPWLIKKITNSFAAGKETKANKVRTNDEEDNIASGADKLTLSDVSEMNPPQPLVLSEGPNTQVSVIDASQAQSTNKTSQHLR